MRVLVLWSVLLVTPAAIASPFPAPPATPKDLALDTSSLVLDQVRPASTNTKLALCPYERTACEAACVAGSQLSCTRLGVALIRDKKPEHAKEVLEKACAKKEWSACLQLADLVEDWEAKSTKTACKAGHATSCATIVKRAMGDDPVAPYNEAGCRAGDGAACLRIAETAKPAVAKTYVKKALATGRGVPLACPVNAAPMREIEIYRSKPPRWSWRCTTLLAGGLDVERHGPFVSFASEEDARAYPASVIAERGTFTSGRHDGTFESFDERGRLIERRQYANDKQIGDSFELAYDDAKLVSVRRVRWVEGTPTDARQLDRAPVETIEIGSAELPLGTKGGSWLRIRAGRVVGQTTYRRGVRVGEAIEWDARGAFVAQTTYERDVPIRRRIPKGDALVDDPSFEKR